MSDLAVAYARQHATDLPRRQAQVLHYLAGIADHAHSVTISRAELARRTGIPLPSIKGILDGLVAKGLLVCERQTTDAYGYVANRYTFAALARRAAGVTRRITESDPSPEPSPGGRCPCRTLRRS